MKESSRNIPVRNIRRGTYCSPACGFNCTWKAHQDAVAAANRLVTRLGKGWSKRVWENAGWHWEVTDSTCRLTVYKQGKFYVAIATPMRTAGRTPEEAVTALLLELEQHVTQLNAIYLALERSCEGMLSTKGRPSRRKK